MISGKNCIYVLFLVYAWHPTFEPFNLVHPFTLKTFKKSSTPVSTEYKLL
jgi:hypothetical protein